MTGKMNWGGVRDRDRIARQGADSVASIGLPGGTTPPKKPPGKAALRAELAAAQRKITRTIKCVCGHEGTAIVPASKARARLRCSKCGEVAA
ncbi:hypothetical protein HFO05_12265 [Rhizobium laguerreae]|uniref:hypothetical protein n=1 Tax=Rhizobium laguerreae TaxID=1076926 RepID=UPI001C8FB5F5|nr:hypothetical protein [Rhizobium laguerreae]MBY3269380.1 hypothetical protein [Rhizobium laguerreae]